MRVLRRQVLRLALTLGVMSALTAGSAWTWKRVCARSTYADEAERLAEAAVIRPGMQVAEIGAGDGDMAIGVARLVGPEGHLFANEIDARSLRQIRRTVSAAGLDNVSVVEGTARAAGIPQNCCDVVYMRRVYHHFTQADTMMQVVRAALRPGGRLAVIDFIERGTLGLRGHGIAREELTREVTRAGFRVERVIDNWSGHDYCVVFIKPAA